MRGEITCKRTISNLEGSGMEGNIIDLSTCKAVSTAGLTAGGFFLPHPQSRTPEIAVFLTVTCVLILVSMIASLAPALRAVTVDQPQSIPVCGYPLIEIRPRRRARCDRLHLQPIMRAFIVIAVFIWMAPVRAGRSDRRLKR